MRSALRRLLLVLVIGGTIVALGAWTRRLLGVDLDVESVRAFAEGLGPTGPILFVLVVAGRAALALPSQVVLIAAGLCFGPWMGTLVGGIGLTASGLVTFLAARYAGRRAVERQLGARLGRVADLAGNRAGALVLAVGTGYPIAPLSPIQAAAGLTPMTPVLFLAAAFVGAAARSAMFAWFGSALAEANVAGMALAATALVAIVLVPLATPAGRRWACSWLAPEPADRAPETSPGLPPERMPEAVGAAATVAPTTEHPGRAGY